MVTVDVWADVRCPWCWIGHRRLSAAVARVPGEVRVRRRSFLLEPDGPPSPGKPLAEVAVTEWGMPPEWWRERTAVIEAEGRRTGLEINSDSLRAFDSRLLHRLLKLVAAERGEDDQEAAWDVAFDAHFRRNLDLSRRDGTVEVATQLGLGAVAVDRLVAGDEFAGGVLDDHRDAERAGVRAVPTVAIGDRMLSGSRSIDELVGFISGDGAAR
ncbi:DsbA family protein [Plantactinospora sp. GCM10030261]|uniref:DsbA family oxidoreductase n=1 Tax=Plantactinospora sp. GCM10030261 TaxID=3273420 RepID=UPI003607535A